MSAIATPAIFAASSAAATTSVGLSANILLRLARSNVHSTMKLLSAMGVLLDGVQPTLSRRRRGVHEPQPVRDRRRLAALARVELAEDVRDVHTGRVLGDEQ